MKRWIWISIELYQRFSYNFVVTRLFNVRKALVPSDLPHSSLTKIPTIIKITLSCTLKTEYAVKKSAFLLCSSLKITECLMDLMEYEYYETSA